jgi:hypothetical protein
MTPEMQPSSGATVYRIVVRGRLTKRFAASFDGMRIEPGDETSALVGRLRDQSHLMGVLQAVDGLGLELISAAPNS